MIEKRAHAALEHGLSAQVDKLFRTVPAEPRPAAAGGDDGCYAHKGKPLLYRSRPRPASGIMMSAGAQRTCGLGEKSPSDAAPRAVLSLRSRQPNDRPAPRRPD